MRKISNLDKSTLKIVGIGAFSALLIVIIYFMHKAEIQEIQSKCESQSSVSKAISTTKFSYQMVLDDVKFGRSYCTVTFSSTEKHQFGLGVAKVGNWIRLSNEECKELSLIHISEPTRPY